MRFKRKYKAGNVTAESFPGSKTIWGFEHSPGVYFRIGGSGRKIPCTQWYLWLVKILTGANPHLVDEKLGVWGIQKS